MKNLDTHRTNRRSLIVIVAFVSLLAAVFGIMSGAAQSPAKEEREVEDRVPKHLPIKVKVKNEPKVKDLKNDEWLRDIELEVTNTGTKPIYFMEISLRLPNVLTDDERDTGYNLYYGRPELIRFDESVRPDDVPLRPGETVTLKVPDIENEMVSWKHFRAKGRFRNPKKMYFKFQVISFGDGTGFVGPTGVPIPEKKEQSSNGRCGGGDEVGEAAVASNSPPQYFTDSAYLPTTYLSPPVSFMTAAFVARNSSPEPSAKRDVCCPVANCPHIKFNQDQGCPCGGLRNIVESAPCSDPQGVCSTIEYTPKTCYVNGFEVNCEESSFGPPVALQPPLLRRRPRRLLHNVRGIHPTPRIVTVRNSFRASPDGSVSAPTAPPLTTMSKLTCRPAALQAHTTTATIAASLTRPGAATSVRATCRRTATATPSARHRTAASAPAPRPC